MSFERGLYKSTDGGKNFEHPTLPNRNGQRLWSYDKGVHAHAENVFVGTRDGLVKSNNYGNSFELTTSPYSFGDSTIDSLCVDGNSIYVGTKDGVFITNDGVRFEKLLSGEVFKKQRPTSIAVRGQTILVGTSSRLFVSNSGGATFQKKLKNPKSIFLAEDAIYVGTSAGLYVSYDNAQSFTYVQIGEEDDYDLVIRTVFVCGKIIYAGTNSALFVQNGLETKLHFFARYSSVTSLFVDNTSIYVGTSSGFFVFPVDEIKSIDEIPDNSLRGMSISSISGQGRNIYAATEFGLAVSTNGGLSFEFKTTAHGLGSNVVKTVATNGKQVFIGTTAGLQTNWVVPSGD